MSVYDVRCESTFIGHLKREARFAYQKNGILVIARVCEQTQWFCESVSAKSDEPIPERADTVMATCVWESAAQLWLGFNGSMAGYPGDAILNDWRQLGQIRENWVVSMWAYCWLDHERHQLLETEGVGFYLQAGTDTSESN